jgi:hypothetical protein
MEPPLRIELSKFSHFDVIQLVLPFIPGLVVTVGLMLSTSSLAHRFGAIPLGYKTKLAVAIAITYVIGSAMITLAQAVEIIINRIIKRGKTSSPWENTYWRRVVAAYMGPDLIPGTKPFSIEDLDRIGKYFVQQRVVTSDPTKQLTSYRNRVRTLEDRLNELSFIIDAKSKSIQNPADVNEVQGQKQTILTEAFTLLQHELKPAMDNIEGLLRENLINHEWLSLYLALQFITPQHPNKNPFTSFSVLWQALQISGVAAIWLMVQYHEFWNLGGMLVSVALVLATTYGIFKTGWWDDVYTYHTAAQLAIMIQELKQRSGKEASAASSVLTAPDPRITSHEPPVQPT